MHTNSTSTSLSAAHGTARAHTRTRARTHVGVSDTVRRRPPASPHPRARRGTLRGDGDGGEAHAVDGDARAADERIGPLRRRAAERERQAALSRRVVRRVHGHETEHDPREHVGRRSAHVRKHTMECTWARGVCMAWARTLRLAGRTTRTRDHAMPSLMQVGTPCPAPSPREGWPVQSL